MPVENLISPDALRKLVWHNPPVDGDLADYIRSALTEGGARPWQVNQLAELLMEPLLQREPLVSPEPEVDEAPATPADQA